MIECICIDDKNKPSTIPPNKWINRGSKYNIIAARVVLPQKQLAVQLLEISLDDSCAPFTYFLGKRFMIKEDDMLNLIELIKETIEVDNSIREMLQEQELIHMN
jgi:hypothetical protein